MDVTTKKMKTYDIVIHLMINNFQLDVNVTEIDKREPLTLDGPHYKQVIESYSHLEDVQMDNEDTNTRLPHYFKSRRFCQKNERENAYG